MQKMRVGLVVTLVAGLLLMGGSRAGAVVGIPDDVPAATLLFPFFKVDPNPGALSRQDTLIVVTNTSNPGAVPSAGAHTWVHITIWSVTSKHIYDFSVQLTPHDVFSCSLLDLLVNPQEFESPCGGLQAPTGVVADLTVGNILAGYVTADVVSGPTSDFPGQPGYPFKEWNILIGHSYLVNLPAGSATGFNAVGIEAVSNFGDGTVVGHAAFGLSPDQQTGFYLTRCIEEQGGGAASPCAPFGSYGNRERIDGPAGDVAQTGDAEQPVVTEDSPLSLLVRYFSVPALNGRSEVWLWKDRNTTGAATNVNLAVYDEEENSHSVTFNLPNEVNFAPTASIITPGAPGGWFRIEFLCGQFGYCGYNPLDEATFGAGGSATPIQSVAYSLQFANNFGEVEPGPGSEFLRWDALFPAHRQYTNYQGGASAE